MRKFEVNKTSEKIEPTQEQIKRHKDFSRLQHNYDLVTKRGKKPIYRDKKRLMTWTLIAIILLIIFLEYCS